MVAFLSAKPLGRTKKIYHQYKTIQTKENFRYKYKKGEKKKSTEEVTLK